MMVSLDRRSCRPISDIFTLSMVISPPAASSNLKRQSVIEDLPAPVRPTIPICAETHGVVLNTPLSHYSALINKSSRHILPTPSLLPWLLAWCPSERGPVPLGTERCSRWTPHSPVWAIQVGASCPPPPRGPVNTNTALHGRKTFWATH